MQPFRTVRVVLCLLICLMYASVVNADRIYLKDGTVVVSDKVWQSRDHVHFILKGTQNVEIRYVKEIVAKIESQGKSLKPGLASTPPSPAKPLKAASPKPVKKETDAGDAALAGGKEKQPPKALAPVDKSAVISNRGLSFYDPRRGKRYWASRNSKHDMLDDALQALAKQYDRTPQWVASHMGEENNLSEIHANLIQQREAEISTSTTPKSKQPTAQRLFYDEGREYPYHVGSGRDFKTRKAALEALARQYHQSEEWVNQNIGDQTDLDAIHRILAQAAADKAASTPKFIGSAQNQNSGAASHTGLEFYNPRREQKYWTGKMARHNTLKEALKALAKQYGVSTEWIESNMGNTNDLETIHRNIRKSLK